ncbi:YcxB family protein [Parasphingorhabdus cellanae]|uniref:YcxB family protein n=1 Tax=Parasphingorhabdus cellanae TaxID=2806553 RepID=A0ABX7T3H2_9SPHN|nr:YcxB family protein [Parasphingorhabdus cellanae]QTD56086.1 YcxB family protein [Parasphingorhabdus cellanae]
MSEKIVFTPCEDDLRAAYSLHMKQIDWKRMGLLIALAFIVSIAWFLFDGSNSLKPIRNFVLGMTVWVGVVILLVRFALPIWWAPRLSKKIYKQQKDLQLETITWWDDEKLYSSNDQGHSNLTFADMVKWRANNDIILLYRSDHLFNFLPVRIFKDLAHKDGLIRRLNGAGVPGETKS